MKRNLVIGLTGGIATGKTTVAKMFSGLGARVISADAVSREIMAPGKPAFRKLISAFGKGFARPNGSIDRAMMGKLVFANAAKRKLLQKITHPYIIKEISGRIKRSSVNPKRPLVVEAPLLFEAGLERMFDKIVTVWAPEKIQLARLRSRYGFAREDALARINSQIPVNKKRKMADYSIDNSRSLSRARENAKIIWKLLTKR